MNRAKLQNLKPRPTGDIVRVNPEDWDAIISDDLVETIIMGGLLGVKLDGKTILSDPYVERGCYVDGPEDKARLIATYKAGHKRCQDTIRSLARVDPSVRKTKRFLDAYLEQVTVLISDADLNA